MACFRRIAHRAPPWRGSLRGRTSRLYTRAQVFGRSRVPQNAGSDAVAAFGRFASPPAGTRGDSTTAGRAPAKACHAFLAEFFSTLLFQREGAGGLGGRDQ